MSESLVKQTKLKKILRFTGLLLSILCCAYVGREIYLKREVFQNDFGPDLFLAFAVSCIFWIMVNVSLGVGWRWIIIILGEKISTRTSIMVSFRTQAAKYLPGNIFHHLGRTVLAHKHGVTLSNAGISIVLESLILVLMASLLGISFLSQQVYFEASLLVLFGLILVVIIVLIKTNLLRRLYIFRNIQYNNPIAWTIIGISYSGVFFFQSCMFISFSTVVADNLRLGFFEVLEMVSIAWAAGFVVLGAPGGMGVREAVYSTFAQSEELEWQLLYIATLMRVSSIVGDLICFIFSGVFFTTTQVTIEDE